jgi:hypothetical protein
VTKLLEIDSRLSSTDQRNKVLSGVYEKIFWDANGLTQEEFNKVKDLLTAPGETVNDVVEISLNLGNCKWAGEGENRRLVRDLSSANLILDPEDEDQLRRLVCSSKKEPNELLKNIIKVGLGLA